MTDQELRGFIGKPVRATLADGRIIAGTLLKDDGHSHGHVHYAIVSDPVRAGGEKVQEVIHGSDAFVNIDDASDDPAATRAN